MNTEGGWSSFEQCPGSRALHAVVKIGWVFFKLWEGFEKEEMHGVWDWVGFFKLWEGFEKEEMLVCFVEEQKNYAL